MSTATPPTSDDLLNTLLRLVPHWLSEPGEIQRAFFEAYASMFADVHAASQTLHDRTFIERAEGTWLDEHGRERSKFRRAGETDDAFRARIRELEDKVTKPSIEDGINAILAVGTCTVIDHPLGDPLFVPPTGTTLESLGYVGRSNSFRGTHTFSVVFPDQAPQDRDLGFTSEDPTFGFHCFTVDGDVSGALPSWAMFTADVNTDLASVVYGRVVEVLDAKSPAGVEARPIIGS